MSVISYFTFVYKQKSDVSDSTQKWLFFLINIWLSNDQHSMMINRKTWFRKHLLKLLMILLGCLS